MKLKVVTYQELKLSQYSICYIKQFIVTQEINEHATMLLSAVLTDEMKEEVIHQETEVIEVYYMEEGQKKSLFNGILTKISMNTDGQFYYLQIEAKSYSYSMDIQKRSRSFQNIEMTSIELIQQVMKQYPKGDCIIEIPNKPIGELVVQYEETDWEFIKRFISRYHEGLYPEVMHSPLKYYIGKPKILKEVDFEDNPYSLSKDIKSYREAQVSGLSDLEEVDYVIYHIQASEILPLGAQVKYKGHLFYINSVKRILEGGELLNQYQLQFQKGLNKKKLYNEKITGISITGTIIEVQRNRVRVKLEIDSSQEKHTAYWFPYATMAASDDGSGWYCMPEIGERVRIYVPTHDEKEALAITNIQHHRPTSLEPTDKMGNPDVKRLRTEKNKEIRFTEDGVLIDSDQGAASILLGKDGNISFVGVESLSLNAIENISFRAEKELLITADKTLDILCEKEGHIQFTEAREILVDAKVIKENE